MSDPRDLGVALTDKSGTQTPGFEPDLHLYDNCPGGTGQSQPLYQMQAQLLADASQVAAGVAASLGGNVSASLNAATTFARQGGNDFSASLGIKVAF